jgi:hypothetical protein
VGAGKLARIARIDRRATIDFVSDKASERFRIADLRRVNQKSLSRFERNRIRHIKDKNRERGTRLLYCSMPAVFQMWRSTCLSLTSIWRVDTAVPIVQGCLPKWPLTNRWMIVVLPAELGPQKTIYTLDGSPLAFDICLQFLNGKLFDCNDVPLRGNWQEEIDAVRLSRIAAPARPPLTDIGAEREILFKLPHKKIDAAAWDD